MEPLHISSDTYLVYFNAGIFCTATKLKQKRINVAYLVYLFAETFYTTIKLAKLLFMWCRFGIESDKQGGRGNGR